MIRALDLDGRLDRQPPWRRRYAVFREAEISFLSPQWALFEVALYDNLVRLGRLVSTRRPS